MSKFSEIFNKNIDNMVAISKSDFKNYLLIPQEIYKELFECDSSIKDMKIDDDIAEDIKPEFVFDTLEDIKKNGKINKEIENEDMDYNEAFECIRDYYEGFADVYTTYQYKQLVKNMVWFDMDKLEENKELNIRNITDFEYFDYVE